LSSKFWRVFFSETAKVLWLSQLHANFFSTAHEDAEGVEGMSKKLMRHCPAALLA
jgi:hypothetical protein